MLSNGITQFLAKATGPWRLREELRLRTKPINTFLKAVDSLSTVREKVPKGVLGGDIIAFMSEGLKQLLQYSEPGEHVVDAGPSKRSRFTGGPGASSRSESSEISLIRELSEESSRVFAPQESPMPSSAGLSIHKEETGGEKHKPSEQKATPMLVEKVREYWQLNQMDQASTQSSNWLTEVGRDAVKDTPPFSASPLNTLSPRSWPDKVGLHVAQKIQSIVSGQRLPDSPKRVQQTMHSDLPEKIEIQNIFNLDVEAKRDRGEESLQDLSEKIADVLREQALQHGIDIT